MFREAFRKCKRPLMKSQWPFFGLRITPRQLQTSPALAYRLAYPLGSKTSGFGCIDLPDAINQH